MALQNVGELFDKALKIRTESSCAEVFRIAAACQRIPRPGFKFFHCHAQSFWRLFIEEEAGFVLYDRFERTAAVSGKAGNIGGKTQAGGNPFEAPRANEYPLPAIESTLAGEMFAKAAGLSMTHVPYKGSVLSINDVMSGQLQMTFEAAAAGIQHLKTGRLKALATLGGQRWPMLPDVPTAAETVPGFEVVVWLGVMAPAGTQQPVIGRLNAEIGKAMQDAEMRKRLATEGADPGTSTPEEYAAYLRGELERWTSVFKKAGIKANPDRRRIPIIFVTAMSTIEDEALGLSLGAVDYITKPVSQPILLAGKHYEVTTSVGVSCHAAAMRSPDDLVAAADRALYGAKRAGRNRVVMEEELRSTTPYTSEVA